MISSAISHSVFLNGLRSTSPISHITLSVPSFIIRPYNLMAMASHLPYFTKGEVIKGFGRGSKDLGCPTANFPPEVVESLPKDFPTGVYFGWASLNQSPVYKMVLNIGWCPYYKNEQKSLETHIIHQFHEDFYGAELKICIAGYLRGEMNFNSLDELVAAIKNDIHNAEVNLDKPEYTPLKNHQYFITNNNKL